MINEKPEAEVASTADAGNEVSPLALAEMFPDPQGLLDTKYRTLEEVKGDCLVALDANVLLMPYLIGKVSLAEAIAVYEPIAAAKRLIIPAHAAREFAKHRSRKIADIVQHLQDQSSRVVHPMAKHIGFLADDPDYLAMKDISDQIGGLAKDLRAKVRALVSRISSDLGNDPVSNSYRGVLKNCVRDAGEPQDPAAFMKELQQRYAAKRPPGYKDKKKPDAGAGDLLIWHTIIRAGLEASKDCIFVTADEKSDWYIQSSGAFQPRLELIEEYRYHTKGRTLHILPLSRLLELYGAQEDAVVEVREAEATRTNATAVGSSLAGDNSSADREWSDLLSQLKNIDEQMARREEAISSFGADQYNTSLALPWNRALHGLRLEYQSLALSRKRIEQRLMEIEGEAET